MNFRRAIEAKPAASSHFHGQLSALDYEQRYYDEHKAAGLDYLAHGYWQQSYAAMVTDAMMQRNYDAPFVLDAGCACGSILAGFKATGVYARVMGVDLSAHMVSLGRSRLGLSDSEIVAGTIEDIPLDSGCVSLVHSAQVLEHIPAERMPRILGELTRILRPGGRMFLCLDAVKDGETREKYMGDPTHCNIQPFRYWTQLLQQHGLLFDAEAFERFARAPHGPTQGEPLSFFQHYPDWSTYTLIKS